MPPKSKKERFIPGLNSRPDDIEMPPKLPEKVNIIIIIIIILALFVQVYEDCC